MKLSKKASFISLLGAFAIALSSCSWDTISRAQAKQILESIRLYRGVNYKFDFPRDKTNSILFRRQYFDHTLNNQVQEYTKIVASPVNPGRDSDQSLYIKNFTGVGREYTTFFEGYYYVENNIFYSKERVDSNSKIWNCDEIKDPYLVDGAFVTKRTELILQAVSIVTKFDDIEKYINLLNSITTPENIYSESIGDDVNVVVKEKYESYGHHSVKANITFYDVLINSKQANREYSFAFNDIYLTTFSSFNYLSDDREQIQLDVNYDAYISIPHLDFDCGESENISEPINAFKN